MNQNQGIASRRLLSEELFVYADQFKTAALWDKLGELQLFAVQNGDEDAEEDAPEEARKLCDEGSIYL